MLGQCIDLMESKPELHHMQAVPEPATAAPRPWNPKNSLSPQPWTSPSPHDRHPTHHSPEKKNLKRKLGRKKKKKVTPDTKIQNMGWELSPVTIGEITPHSIGAIDRLLPTSATPISPGPQLRCDHSIWHRFMHWDWNILYPALGTAHIHVIYWYHLGCLTFDL